MDERRTGGERTRRRLVAQAALVTRVTRVTRAALVAALAGASAAAVLAAGPAVALTPGDPGGAAAAGPTSPALAAQAPPQSLSQALPQSLPQAPAADPPADAAPADPPAPAVTFIGIPGLRWADVIGATPTPALTLMARQSALGSMSVRTAEATACPLDGWLTLNSGARAIGPRPGGDCAPVADFAPVPAPDAVAVPAPGAVPAAPDAGDTAQAGTAATRVPGWDALIEGNADYSYDPVWGTLAGARDGDPGTPDTARCAVGPGAAIALADATGRVRATYAERVADLPPHGCAELLVVDAGALPTGPGRAGPLRAADDLVAVVREAINPDGGVLVAGIADSDPDQAHLAAVLAEPGRGLGGLVRGWLWAESTRREGSLAITDLTPTLAPAPADLVGATLQARPRFESTPTAVRDLHRRDVAAQVMRDQFVPFFSVLIAGQLAAYGLATLALRAGRISRRGCARVVRTVGLGFGAAPAASVLANLLPWRATAHPAVALWAVLIATSATIAALALAGPWRRRAYGPAGAVATVTAGVFAIDVTTGSGLQIDALFGLSPLVAGRFYGFGNIAFAVFAMSTLVAAGWAGAELVARGRSRAAAGVAVGALGTLAVLVDGLPSFGADFGGVIALLPGVAVLACGVAAIRLTAARVAGVAALTLLTVSAIAVLDWTRPAAERTHLGRFVQDVLDGEAAGVIARKAGANLGLLVDAPVIVLAAAPLFALGVLTVFRPQALRLDALARAQAQDTVLRPLLLACLCTAVIGFAANDSGVIVPAVALIAAGPLLAVIWAGLWAREPDAAPAAAAAAEPAHIA